MKNPPTLATVLSILSVIVIPLLIWGINVETRFTSTVYRIQQLEKQNTKIELKLEDMRNKINHIDKNISILVAKYEME